jgi:hypothetical protein
MLVPVEPVWKGEVVGSILRCRQEMGDMEVVQRHEDRMTVEAVWS